MNTTQIIHIVHIDDHDEIRCQLTSNWSQTEGRPVIYIDGPVADGPRVCIYPTPGRLRRLRDAISAYLAEHGDHGDDGPADRIDIISEPVPIPAEACTGAADDRAALALAEKGGS